MINNEIILIIIYLFIYSIVEFARRDDMKYALSRYNNTKLNGQRVTLEEPVSIYSSK